MITLKDAIMAFDKIKHYFLVIIMSSKARLYHPILIEFQKSKTKSYSLSFILWLVDTHIQNYHHCQEIAKVISSL